MLRGITVVCICTHSRAFVGATFACRLSERANAAPLGRTWFGCDERRRVCRGASRAPCRRDRGVFAQEATSIAASLHSPPHEVQAITAACHACSGPRMHVSRLHANGSSATNELLDKHGHTAHTHCQQSLSIRRSYTCMRSSAASVRSPSLCVLCPMPAWVWRDVRFLFLFLFFCPPVNTHLWSTRGHTRALRLHPHSMLPDLSFQNPGIRAIQQVARSPMCPCGRVNVTMHEYTVPTGVSCLLCSSAVPGVWSFLHVTQYLHTMSAGCAQGACMQRHWHSPVCWGFRSAGGSRWLSCANNFYGLHVRVTTWVTHV